MTNSSDRSLVAEIEEITGNVMAVRSVATDYRPSQQVYPGVILDFRVRSGVLASTEMTIDADSGRVLRAQILLNESTAVVRRELDVARTSDGVPRAVVSQWSDECRITWEAPEWFVLGESMLTVLFVRAFDGLVEHRGDGLGLLLGEANDLGGIVFHGLSDDDVRRISNLVVLQDRWDPE